MLLVTAYKSIGGDSVVILVESAINMCFFPLVFCVCNASILPNPEPPCPTATFTMGARQLARELLKID